MSKITTTDGTQIYYKDWGPRNSQPIVFHHGWPLSADDWDTQMLFSLGHGYRVVAFDRRGHGRSSQVADGHDMDHYAADAAALVHHLDLRDSIHIGHSTGGGEATRYVARHGAERVAKLVLIGAVPPIMLQTPDNPGGLPIEVFDEFRQQLAANRSEFYLNVASGPFYGSTHAKEILMSSEPESLIYLARHGETAWSLTGRHTGLTDLPLTERGERNACQLGVRLKGLTVSHVFVSPLRRARQTCDLAGFGARAEIDEDLVEWNYGEYEGLTTAEIHERNPDWRIFRDGCPGGESVADVSARAERVVAKYRALDKPVLTFSSGHFLEMFTVRWLNLPASTATNLYLDTASMSIVGYHRTKSHPVLRLWNCRRHAESEDGSASV